jgi:hypothetical protein
MDHADDVDESDPILGFVVKTSASLPPTALFLIKEDS